MCVQLLLHSLFVLTGQTLLEHKLPLLFTRVIYFKEKNVIFFSVAVILKNGFMAAW